MKLFSLKNVCLALLVLLQVLFAGICIYRICLIIDDAINMNDFYTSVNTDMEEWRIKLYFENITREVLGLLACALGAVSSIFLLLKLNKRKKDT